MTDTDIKIKIDAIASGASKEIKSLTKQIDTLNKKVAQGGKASVGEVGQMTRSFKSLTAHVSKLAIIYGSFHTLITSTVITAKFEESIKKLGVFSGTTATELEELEAKAKELGESTVFSASQVAEGMNEMALAGLKSEEMLDGIGDVLNLAQVGMLDLKTASDFTITSMKAFGLESKDIGDITDIMAKASTISATNVTQLGQALTKVGQNAKAYNVSLAMTASALGVLADAGRRGTEAGTQLKIVMSRLAGNKEALKYLDELGISMYDANNNLLPFNEQLRIVRDRLSSMSEKARNIKLAQIFGSEASSSAIALINNYDKMLEKLELIKQAMVDDFAQTSAVEMVDTLIGSFKNLMSALEGLAIKIMSELTPSLRAMLDGFTEMVRGMDDEAIYDFAEALGFVIESITGLTSVMADVGSMTVGFLQQNKSMAVAVGGVAVALKLMGKEMRALFATLMLNPVYAGLAGVIALTLTYVDAIENKSRAIAKELALEEKRGEAFTKTVDAIVEATDRETGAIGKTNVERAKLAQTIANTIASLEKQRSEMDESSMTSEEYADKQELLTDQINSLDNQLVKIGGSWIKESDAIAQVTAKQIILNEVTSDALKNYTKFATTASKRYVAVAKVIDRLEKKEIKLRDKIKSLEEDKLRIFSEYADKRANVNQDYDSTLYDARTKDLTDHKKYLSDKTRAIELAQKADEALARGSIGEASRYYEEAKSLASSFAGDAIKENDTVLVSSKKTYEEAEAIYKRTKEGELAILKKQEEAELNANAQKMKLVKIQLQATLAQIKSQEALATAILKVGAKWEEEIGDFGNETVFAKAKKELEDLILQIGNSKVTITPEVDGTKADSDLDAQIERMKNRVKPKFSYTVVADEKSIEDAKNKVEDTEVTQEVNIETSEDYFNRIQKEIDARNFKSEVDLEENPDDIKNIEDSLASADIVAPFDLDNKPALATANKTNEQISGMTAVMDADANTRPAIATANNAVAKINGMVAYIDVYTRYHSATGGYIPQHLAVGGEFTGSGRVAGYDPTDSDKVNAKLTGGEFVVKREAVDAYGLGLLYDINNKTHPIPKFASGGFVGTGLQTPSSNTLTPININLGGESFGIMAEGDIGRDFVNFMEKEGGL